MNRLLLAAISLGIVLAAAAADGKLTSLERKAKLDAVVNRRVGGFIEKPGSGRGSIVYVNCQQKASKAWIDESIAYFSELTKFKIVYSEGSFAITNPKIHGDATIFVIEDESLPPILVAPESRWALVNIAPISQEKRTAFFEQRTKKELSRAFAYLCGAAGSRYERSLTRGITRQSELDKNPGYELPMDVVQRFWDYMKPLGVLPVQRSTYLKACQEGWAPTPTNEVQRAIWEKIHAVPDKPITIEFDLKKSR